MFPIQNSMDSHQGGAQNPQALQTDLTTWTLPVSSQRPETVPYPSFLAEAHV